MITFDPKTVRQAVENRQDLVHLAVDGKYGRSPVKTPVNVSCAVGPKTLEKVEELLCLLLDPRKRME